ncbi:MAG: hypothetical protein AVDCRST_MAG19-3982, partial [uncultured Thermomicrobiales bacterium]
GAAAGGPRSAAAGGEGGAAGPAHRAALVVPDADVALLLAPELRDAPV